MNWASVIEELERQAAFADGMSAKNTIDQEIAKAFGVKADMLIAIAAHLRAMEDYNGFWTERQRTEHSPSSDTNRLRPKAKANKR